MKFTLSLVLLLVSSFSFLVSAFPSSVHAQTTQAWSGRCVGTGANSDVATIQGLECLFYNVLQIIVMVAGLAFFAMFISGGFKYLFSSNDQKAVAAASSTLTMAIIGLVGIIASWLILSFIQKFTGVNVTIFKIPGNP